MWSQRTKWVGSEVFALMAGLSPGLKENLSWAFPLVGGEGMKSAVAVRQLVTGAFPALPLLEDSCRIG